MSKIDKEKKKLKSGNAEKVYAVQQQKRKKEMNKKVKIKDERIGIGR